MKKYKAQSGIIREVNPHLKTEFCHQPDGFCQKDCVCLLHQRFESAVQSYATDLPDGEYLEDEITEPILQYELGDKWYGEYELGEPALDWTYRQFVTAKPKEESDVSRLLDNQNISDRSKQAIIDKFYSADLISRKAVIEAIEAMRGGNNGRVWKEDLLTIIKNIK